MAHELLGESFDIHAGGIDLQFPHHENEIAQSMCAHPKGGFARVWLHNEMLQVEGRKMSKSLGNFFTVRDLLDKGVPGEVIRYVMLMTHYRSPMDWTEKKREEAEATLRKWRRQTGSLEPAPEPYADVLSALADDLNTAGALSAMHQLSHVSDARTLLASARLLGLLQKDTGDWTARPGVDPAVSMWIEQLLGARVSAKAARNFERADAIRAGLVSAGVEVRDTPTGSEWELTPSFDLAKLDALR
jgi:cysteinyl-tRNA synthetase